MIILYFFIILLCKNKENYHNLLDFNEYSLKCSLNINFEIFPVAVCGISFTKAMSSGIHHRAIFPCKKDRISSLLTKLPLKPLSPLLSCGTMISNGRSPHFLSGMPITAASFTPGCPTASFSMATELIHSPPLLITSLDRSVICSR